jgi:hypothetical protein
LAVRFAVAYFRCVSSTTRGVCVKAVFRGIVSGKTSGVTPLLRTIIALAALAAVAGCGDDDEGSGKQRAPAPASITKVEYVARVDKACRNAMNRWKDPLDVERDLPESPIQTSATGRDKTAARELRGYRAIVQDVIDAVRGKPQPEGGRGAAEEYALELSKAATEMENDELILRQGWDRASYAPVIRRHLRNARRLAKQHGFEDCARF